MDANPSGTKVFWNTDDRGRARVLDLARQDKAGEWVTIYSRRPRNLSEMQAKFPGAQLGTHEEFKVEHNNSWRQPPTQITKEDYWGVLEILPPQGCIIHRADLAESFKILERLSGEMALIYARSGDTYWRMIDSINTPHEKIMEAVMATQEEVPADRPRM